MSIKRIFHQPGGLAIILVLAAALRLVAAFFSIGFDHPHENYRFLEILASVSGYSAYPPMEWREALLSPIPIRLQLGLLHGASAIFGLSAPISQVIFFRIVYALLSLFQVYCAWRLTRVATGSLKLACFSALAVSVWPEFVYRSVRLIDYSLETSFLAIAVVGVLGEFRRHALAWVAVAGISLGVCFFFRYQSGLYLIALMAILLWDAWRSKPGSRTKLILLGAAYGITVISIGLVESGGSLAQLFLPFKNYMQYNLVLGGAEKDFGADPWHRYFSEVAKVFGIAAFPALLALVFSSAPARRIFVVPFIVILVHTLISHKEGRFVYAVLFLFFPAAFSSLASVRPVRWVRALILVALVSGFAVSFGRIQRRFLVHADLTRAFAEAGQKLDAVDPDRKTPLIVRWDPVESPGAFYLRPHGVFCYESFRNFSQCPRDLKSAFVLEPERDLRSGDSVLWTARGWALTARK